MQNCDRTRNREDRISAQSLGAESLKPLVPASTKAGSREIAGFGDQIGTSISCSILMEKS